LLIGGCGSNQCFHANTQRHGNSGDVADGNVALTSFDRADVVGVKVSNLRHLLLSQFLLMPNASHVCCEKLLRITLLSLVAHAQSVSGQHP
jgi:hypothetical protein